MDLKNKTDIPQDAVLSSSFNPITKMYTFTIVIGDYWHKSSISQKYIHKKMIKDRLNKYMKKYLEYLCDYYGINE